MSASGTEGAQLQRRGLNAPTNIQSGTRFHCRALKALGDAKNDD